MNYPAGMGPVLSNVEIATDDVLAIAKGLSKPTQDASAAQTSLTNIGVSHADFGGSPEAKTFATQHASVVEVFQTTITDLLSDLQTFQQNLQHAAQDHVDNDAHQEQALGAFGKKMDGYKYASDRGYKEAREHAGKGLGGLPQAPGESQKSPAQTGQRHQGID